MFSEKHQQHSPLFTKCALIPTKFFLRKIAVFVRKKSTDHSRELVLFFRQACFVKIRYTHVKILSIKQIYVILFRLFHYQFVFRIFVLDIPRQTLIE